jgi:ribosomal protein L11 methylase PrmA
MERKRHWDTVYKTKTDLDVGWYQEYPDTSLELIENYSRDHGEAIIDVGGGNSHLSRILFENGYIDLSVLDLSSQALKRSKSRFGKEAGQVNWIESDILQFEAKKAFQIWHDRAVFHFLLAEENIKKYAHVASKSIVNGGFLILGTFSLTGPKMCSGLPITQYCEEDFCKVFENNFELVECFENVHTTPSGNPQNFIWVVFRKI